MVGCCSTWTFHDLRHILGPGIAMTCSPHASWILGETHPHHVPALRRLPSEHLPQHTPLRTVHSSAIVYYISIYFTLLFYCTISWYITVCRCLQMFAASLLSMHYHAFTCFCSVAPLRSQPLRSQRISRGLAWECVRFCSKVLRKGKQIQKCVLFTVVPCLESNWRDKKRSTKTVSLGSIKFQFLCASSWQSIQV